MDAGPERKAARKQGKPAISPTFKPLIIAGALLIGLLLIMYVSTVVRSGSTAPPRTTVGTVDISGMTKDEAAKAVAAVYGPVAKKRLKVTAGGQTFVVKPAQAGMRVDAEASVDPAFGRTFNPATMIGHLFGASSLPVLTTVDEAALTAQVQAIADSLNVEPRQPSVEVLKGETTVTAGKPGTVIDIPATEAALKDALLEPRNPIPAVVTTIEPAISEASTQQAVDFAKTAVSAPVTVKADTVTATISQKVISDALTFEADGSTLTPVLDGAMLHKSIAKELKPLEVPGSDASFKIKKGVPVVVPSKVGKGVSNEDLASAVMGALSKPAAERTVTVTVGLREPKLTTEEAQGLGVVEKISSFTQHFPYAAYRVQNIGQAAERVNGSVVLPGETFSMNNTILERTKANGYTKGFVVGEGGVFDEQLGGGVSTATTTVWTAAFFAGMDRVQTVAHSIYISRYQPGLEATVAWGLFDMKFKNPYDTAVYIKATTTSGSMTVSFWGKKYYDKIEAEFGKRKSIVPYSKIYDSSDKCLGQNGVDGFTITVDRVFYKDGKEVKREPITTHYKPAPDVTCGKDPHAKPSSSGSKPSSSPSSKPSSSSSSGSNNSSGSKPSSKPAPKPSSKPSSKPKPAPKPSSDSGGSGDTFSN